MRLEITDVDMEIDTLEDNNFKYIHYTRVKKMSELDFVQLGYHRTTPIYECGPIIRDHFLIHFVVEGTGKITIYNRIYTVKPNECFLIRPYEIASYVSDAESPWVYYWIGFTGFFAGQYVSATGFSNEHPVIGTGHMDGIIDTFSLVEEGCYNTSNIMLYKSIIYRLLHYLTTEKISHQFTSPPVNIHEKKFDMDDYVEKVVSIIQTSYDQSLTVDELARTIGVNRNHLSKVFKERMGMSIKKFMTEYRLDMAAFKLRSTTKSISEIAMETGFLDSLYFSRQFKKKSGLCPSDYRSYHSIQDS